MLVSAPDGPAPPARYRRLDDERLLATLATLRRRIEERFPGSGLGRVAEELLAVSREAAECSAYLQRPHWPLRGAVGLVIALILALLVVVALTLRLPAGIVGLTELVQTVEAAVNDAIFLGLAIFFLLTVERRVKRRRALATLHELRSIVHVVDMHQLTKDPERLLSSPVDTASSPVRSMSPAELGRYLDYCSELLSLASKSAALLVQNFDDALVLAAVNEVETLAGGFSGKIWQKITLLDRAPS